MDGMNIVDNVVMIIEKGMESDKKQLEEQKYYLEHIQNDRIKKEQFLVNYIPDDVAIIHRMNDVEIDWYIRSMYQNIIWRHEYLERRLQELKLVKQILNDYESSVNNRRNEQ